MRKILIATAAAAGLMALGACQPATTEDETDMAEAADDSGMEASAEGEGSMGGGSGGGTGGAAAAGDSGSDASAPGGSGGGYGGAPGGDTATPAQGTTPTSGQTDPMVTGQGSTSSEGRIQMGSEPPHPARQ